jgi:hypothetical protein
MVHGPAVHWFPVEIDVEADISVADNSGVPVEPDIGWKPARCASLGGTILPGFHERRNIRGYCNAAESFLPG